MKSIQDAERGMPLTVDSRMANEMHELVVEAGKLRDRLKDAELDKATWRFWAIVFGANWLLLAAVIFEYKFL